MARIGAICRRRLGREIAAGLKALPGSANARQALLSDADVRKIVEAAFAVDEDFGALVLTLAATGCRFSQASRLRVADLQVEAGRVMVPSSMKGKSMQQRRSAAVPLGADTVESLGRLTTGRAGHEPLLQRWLARQAEGQFAWQPVARVAWQSAGEMRRDWKKALAVAGIRYIEPYSLRHSSIVRSLRAGLPTRLVAALHDTSSTMIERHYGAFILDLSDELARRSIVALISPPPTVMAVVS